MQYRLKDTGLQKKLDELSDGDFSRQLEVNKGHIIMGIEYSELATVWFCKPEGPLHALEITPDMLEKVSEYDPHKWNGYPEVEPPEGVVMRVEGFGKHAAMYVIEKGKGYWVTEAGEKIKAVYRFRPWDEEDEE